MRITDTEVLPDGRVVRLTLSGDNGLPVEHYLVWWDGAGRLGHLMEEHAKRVLDKVPQSAT